MSEAIQIAGALAILVAYALAQFGVIDQRSYAYLILNLLGAIVLGVIAWVEDLWGFFLLERAAQRALRSVRAVDAGDDLVHPGAPATIRR